MHKITSGFSGCVVGEYGGDTPDAALDARAAEEGFKDHAEMCSAVGADATSWTVDPALFAQGGVLFLVERTEPPIKREDWLPQDGADL